MSFDGAAHGTRASSFHPFSETNNSFFLIPCRFLQDVNAHTHYTNLLVLHIIMCNTSHMATNLALDDKLIEEARRAGDHKTKKEAVTAALGEYVRRRKQVRLLEAFGTFEFDPAYDYKAGRRRGKNRR
jgi:Arc/MetJ family transcription regulator